MGLCLGVLLSLALPVQAQAPWDAAGIAVAGSNDHVYAWYRDGTVSSGDRRRFDLFKTPYPYSLPRGKVPSDIVGMAIAGSNDHVYAWYKDGTASSGTSRDLDAYLAPYSYSLPPGKSSSQIVGMAIAPNDRVYTWFDDGTVCAGTSSNLDAYIAPYGFSTPPGRSASEIIGIGIAGSDSHVHTWFLDSTTVSGTSNNLDYYQKPLPFQQHLILKAWWGPTIFRWSAEADSGQDGVDASTTTLPLDPMPSSRPANHLGLKALPSPPLLGQPMDPQVQGVDPMVAVGRNYVLASQHGAIRFLDRQGNGLPIKNGIGPSLSGGALFEPFLNRDSVADLNRYTGFSLDCDDPSYPPTPGDQGFCINEVYDLRVHFDAIGNRFVVVGQSRNQLWTKIHTQSFNVGEECGSRRDATGTVVPMYWTNARNGWCTLARRHVLVAISKTEDPRDGFHLYASTENNYRDFPWATLSTTGHLVLANRGKEMPSGAVATVLSMASLRSGLQRIPYFRYYREDVHNNKRLLLPRHHGTPANLTLMYANSASGIHIYGIPYSSTPYEKPPLASTFVNLPDDFPLWPAVYRSGFLYFAQHVDTELSPNSVLRLNINVGRLSLVAQGWGQSATLHASTDPVDGFRYRSFGLRGPGDDPTDIISYEEPALAVTKGGDMVIGYGRYPVVTQSTLFPEVRYSVWYGNEATQRSSQVLKLGTASTAQTPSERLHYAWADVDPLDDETVWIAHEYSGSQGYRMVLGRVRP